MPAFRVSGATGQAPTTVFFGAIPDKYNMILPGHLANTGSPVPDVLITCNFFNQMSIWNQSFGSGPNVDTGSFTTFTTAPDGTTNTAQKFVEATSNSIHQLGAVHILNLTATEGVGKNCKEWGPLTFAGFFQYSGRRITMMVTGQPISAAVNGDPTLSGGVQATFDLLNGAIGVAPTLTGLAVGVWSGATAEIKNCGGGWYRCSITIVVNLSFDPNMGKCVHCAVYLDNGTGSGAASISYAGDGASGVFGWRVNLMPEDSYALAGATIFFDDFLDSSTIDLANTLQPGFNWYLRYSAPYTPVFADMSPTIISVSGSVLSLAAAALSNGVTDLCTACTPLLTAPSPIVGHTFPPRGIFETRANWDYHLQDNQRGFANPAFWSQAMRFMATQPYQATTFDPTQSPDIGMPGSEHDFWEANAQSGWAPTSSVFMYDFCSQPNRELGDTQGQACDMYGFADWVSTIQYRGTFGVNHGGSFYTFLAISLNNPPPNPTFWTPYVGPPSPVRVDADDFHVWSSMLIPYKRGGYGMMIEFLDGVCTGATSWAPVNNVNAVSHGVVGSTTRHRADAEAIRMIFGGAGGSVTFNVFPVTRADWVKFTA